MASDVIDQLYNKQKQRKEIYYYKDLLCEILFLKFEFGYHNITKEDVLSELSEIKKFKKDKIDSIYENAKELLKIRYSIIVLQDNPLVFKDDRDLG